MTYQERQKRIDAFKHYVQSQSQWYSGLQSGADEIIEYITNDSAPFPGTPISYWAFYIYREALQIFAHPTEWEREDEKLLQIITSPNFWYNSKLTGASGFEESFFQYYLKGALRIKPESTFDCLLQKWRELQLSEEILLNGIINHTDGYGWYTDDNKLSALGKYLLKRAKNDFDSLFRLFSAQNDFRLFNLLIHHDPDFSEAIFPKFLGVRKNDQDLTEVSAFSIKALLKKNPEKYDQLILDKLPAIESAQCILTISFLLRKYLPSKYNSQRVRFSYLFLDRIKSEMDLFGTRFHDYYGYLEEEKGGNVNQFYTEIEMILEDTNEDKFGYLVELFEKSTNIRVKQNLLNKLFPIFKEQLLPIIFSDKGQVSFDAWEGSDYYKNFFKLIQTVDYQPYEPKVWEFTRNKSKRLRELAAVTLSKLGDRIIPEAEKLLNDKKADVRQTGALILSLLKSERAQEILVNAIDAEKNDDARDTMLEGVSGLLSSENTKGSILQKVQKAKERGKLEKPLEWWLDETKLPSLSWHNSQETIDKETIRFLFYRMNRAKDIRTDLEAKPLIALIDRETSGAFAKALLKLYFENGADAKTKFCLTLGGLLGDEDSIDLLKRKVNEWADGGRGKMAEYAVKALALQGSTKALRAVEFFSRKYKNKNKNIGAAANDSFVIAAEELGITPYDLADSIIPDFGFEGLFREFEAGGESYRAFINPDFKIVFLNEDNRLMKSPPKTISKELAEEFKEITKEIRDIVKSQSSRLEQYLVIQRKWEAEKWQAFFLNNPVMFAYAVRLIWGAYDTNGQLQFTFRCEQDQTLMNEEGDEIEIGEHLHIGMVHPISLTQETIEYWNGNLYDADIEPIFPQLKRKVVTLAESEKYLKISSEFKGVKFNGYSFVGKMDKLGWYRGSVVDAGWISSFYKDFSELGITAIITQQGDISVGYLEGNAELNELMFVQRGNVTFGSYVYDEPSNANDKRLIVFGEVPPIVYSEVMADMQFFKDNQIKS